MRIFKALFITCLFHINYNAIALEQSKNVYYPDYYKNEGELLFKIRGIYVHGELKQDKFPAQTRAPKPSSILLKNGMGLDAATSFFFTDNLAAELSLGLLYYRPNTEAVKSVFTAFGEGTASSGKVKNVYVIPATATLQFHIAPFGGIRPYVGAGYHAMYIHTNAKEFKIRHSHGPALQAGIDLRVLDDTLINLDVKQLFLDTNITYRSSYLNTANDVSSKTKWRPIVISLGIGFKL